MTDLLPCPFCGGEASLIGHYISCSECAAQGPLDREAVTGWNTRAATARIEALEKLLRSIEYASRKDSLTDAERLQSIRALLGAEQVHPWCTEDRSNCVYECGNGCRAGDNSGGLEI